MNIVKRSLAELKHPHQNVRHHPEAQIREYVRSLKKNGQLRPIVIDENDVIWIGNGLCDAMLRCGYTEADCLVKPGMSEADKKKMMIADNRIFDLGVDSLDTLNEFLVELKDDLDIPGFDQELLESMVADADEVTKAISGYGTLDDNDLTRMKEAKARRDAAIQNSAPLPPQGMERESEPVQPIPEPPAGEDTSPPETDSQQYILCPKCGEKIWL